MTFEERFNQTNTRQNRCYVIATLAHMELDEEIEEALTTMILQDRAIDQEIRARQLAFAQPFVEAGYAREVQTFTTLTPAKAMAGARLLSLGLSAKSPLDESARARLHSCPPMLRQAELWRVLGRRLTERLLRSGWIEPVRENRGIFFTAPRCPSRSLARPARGLPPKSPCPQRVCFR